MKKEQAEKIADKITERIWDCVWEYGEKMRTGNYNMATQPVTQLALKMNVLDEVKKIKKIN